MKDSEAGTVYLVGAGPGDPGLLTVRALRLIREADVVLHDQLVSNEILAECGEQTFLVDVGKVGHGPQADQTAIEQQLVDFARAGLRVVRLKGGDPFIFGRGGEEALALRAAGVPFEVVPGVSSALAAPACAGIPLTVRGIATSVAIVTGHCLQSRGPASIPLADTIVVLMGVSNAAALRDAVLAVGRPVHTPVAAIERATCARQRVAEGTLGRLPEMIADHGIRAPAVIVIGEVVNLRAALTSLEPRDTATVLAQPASSQERTSIG